MLTFVFSLLSRRHPRALTRSVGRASRVLSRAVSRALDLLVLRLEWYKCTFVRANLSVQRSAFSREPVPVGGVE